VGLGLWVFTIFLLFIAPDQLQLFFLGLFFIYTVVFWAIHIGAGIWEDWKLRTGNHCFMTATTSDEFVYDHKIKVLDSIGIWQAVVTFSVSGEAVLVFGNKKYSAEFERLNRAKKYRGSLPPVVRF
jgi:hypothetical protein